MESMIKKKPSDVKILRMGRLIKELISASLTDIALKN